MINWSAIGIEVQSDGYRFTEEQRASLKILVRYLISLYGNKPEDIIRHADYTFRKWDIGDAFWNNKFKTWKEYVLNSFYNPKKAIKSIKVIPQEKIPVESEGQKILKKMEEDIIKLKKII